LQEQKLTKGVQHKLLVNLLGYDYIIEFKRGRENKAADALSRSPDQQSLLRITSVVPKWIEDITSSYTTDAHCKDLIAKLTLDSNAAPNYTLKSGILGYKNKILVDPDLAPRTQLITTMHDSALGGHW
jgi:hypothetical protein